MAASARLSPAIAASTDPTYRRIPTGSCNFRELNTSIHTTPICGCQRFWLDDSPSRGRTPLCFCGHHACFHHLDSEHSASLVLPDLRDAAYDRPLDTYTLPSTAPPSAVSYDSLRFRHEDLHVGNGRRQPHPLETVITAPYRTQYAHVPEDLIASATEINTPSLPGSPHVELPNYKLACQSMPLHPKVDVKPSHAPNKPLNEQDVIGFTGSRQERDPYTPPPPAIKSLTPDLRNIIQSYARRLDILETASFCHVPAEEIQEKFDLVEGRLLDLEGWRADVQAKHDSEDLPDASTESQEESLLQLAEIEERLGMLEGAYPSYAYPWDIEVVILPWGEALHGIWVTPPETDVSEWSKPSPASEEWNGLASPVHAPLARSSAGGSNLHAPWTPHSPPTSERLVPKSPGPNSVIFKRLQSRGLVRKVTITECGSSSIWNAISSAFHSFLVQNTAYENRLVSAPLEWQGLAQPLVPLRKIRRSSYLQFLDAHEMLTPATWDFAFLKSGTLMKAKEGYRLYVTTPDAYLQADGGQWSWSWLRICGLSVTMQPLVGDDSLEKPASEEKQWDHHPILDYASDSKASSVSSADDNGCWNIRDRSPSGSSSASECLSAVESSSIASPGYAASQTLTWRGPSSSAPELAERTPIPSSSKRSNFSFDGGTWHYKRRRTSTSPDVERRGLCLTPRYSREPRSPSVPGYEADTRSPRLALTHTNGGPQFAYATPHSNNLSAFYEDAGGDTEQDEPGLNSDHSTSDSEKEWEGVADDDQEGSELQVRAGLPEDATDCDYGLLNSSMRSSEMFSGEGESDEEGDDLDDGVTIYEGET